MLCTCSQNYSDMCRTCDEYANNMADIDMDPGPSDAAAPSESESPARRPPGPCPGPTGNLATGTNRPCTASSPCREPAGPRRCCSFSQVFNVLNIEHVQLHFQVFRVQKTISCLLMFTHVQHVQHVLSLFRACSQGLNMLNMQLTAKMAIIFLIMFHFSISC